MEPSPPAGHSLQTQSIEQETLMQRLMISRIKPNPRGMDRPRTGPVPPSDLAAEWVDIKNISIATVSLAGVNLYHRAFVNAGRSEWALIRTLSGELAAGQT